MFADCLNTRKQQLRISTIGFVNHQGEIKKGSNSNELLPFALVRRA